MKKRALVAFVLALSLLFSGCGIVDLESWFGELDGIMEPQVSFSQMEYTRPDLDALEQAAQAVEQKLSQKPIVESLMEQVYAFYGCYHDFYTNYALANIHYCKDLTDIYWEQEYNYCLEASAQVDARLDQILNALADSPLREALEREDYFGPGFFDGYSGESLWSEEFTALMEQQARLESEYYDLCAQATEVPYYSDTYFETYGTQMAEVLAELIKLRQDIAREAGYPDYLSFAYDFYYYRDYSPAQTEQLLEDIRVSLVPLYRQAAKSDVWEIENRVCSQNQTFTYVKKAASAMGGRINEAFTQMEQLGLYDISYGENKYDASFEVFLPSYSVPYVFVNPTGMTYDRLTFAHEFGHFCNDYASYGTIVGVDVAEVFSQGMEYLSLCYGEAPEGLAELKMADSLAIYVEQAAYASFEQQMYAMEDVTAEKLKQLYDRVGKEYGLDVWAWDSRSFVCITHFFTAPVYIVSYVVSNDTALQLYQMELETKGQGLACLEGNLDTQEAGLMAFLQSAQLESPFDEGRLEKVAQLFSERLLK